VRAWLRGGGVIESGYMFVNGPVFQQLASDC
jgi:hypothetical protein